MEEGDEDFTLMHVEMEGREGARRLRYRCTLLDNFDRERGVTSMARTTGYTCTIVARQVARGLFAEKGICPPEFLGRTEGCFEDLKRGYAERGIGLEETFEQLPAG